MESPASVDIGEVFLEDDILEDVLGHGLTAVDEAAEAIIHGKGLPVRKLFIICFNLEVSCNPVPAEC